MPPILAVANRCSMTVRTNLCSNRALPGGSCKHDSVFPSKWVFSPGQFCVKRNSRANCVHASASRKSKVKRDGRKSNGKGFQTEKGPFNAVEELADQSPLGETCVPPDITDTSLNNELSAADTSASSAPRGAVLQACIVTSGLILALGVVIRQVAHVAFMEGWPIHDCSTEVSFTLETWHLELIIGLVLLISSSRYLLLNIWPDFAESTEASNKQILGQLQSLDYLAVAFLPGISEELLFRGALLPLFGLKWESALVVGAIFGVLHLGSGRKYSFAIWATFVGFAYGLTTIASSSLIVPMASHSLNNLVGALIWRYTSNLENQGN